MVGQGDPVKPELGAPGDEGFQAGGRVGRIARVQMQVDADQQGYRLARLRNSGMIRAGFLELTDCSISRSCAR